MTHRIAETQTEAFEAARALLTDPAYPAIRQSEVCVMLCADSDHDPDALYNIFWLGSRESCLRERPGNPPTLRTWMVSVDRVEEIQRSA